MDSCALACLISPIMAGIKGAVRLEVVDGGLLGVDVAVSAKAKGLNNKLEIIVEKRSIFCFFIIYKLYHSNPLFLIKYFWLKYAKI